MDSEHGPSVPDDSTDRPEPQHFAAREPLSGQPLSGQPWSGPPETPTPWTAAAPPPPPAPPPWPGWPGAGWQQFPVSPPRKQRNRRRKGMALMAATAAAGLVAGGSAWAAVHSGSSTLTASTIAARTDPGLVDVISTIGYQGGTAEGTGMVLTSTGEVLTNNHVIAGATSVKVRDIGNGRTYQATVVGYSDTDDVAVLQLQGASGLSTVSIGSSTSLSTGQKVVAIGNAEGRDGTPAVVSGKITALGSTIAAEDQGDGVVEHLTDMIETNADIEPGDSGGPLLNAAGQVVGMDTAASTSDQPGTDAALTTAAFAIPIDRALSIAERIEAGTTSATVHIGTTAFLGVEVSSQASGEGFGGQDGSGAAIEGVVEGTPAAQVGLAAGDTITSLGGQAISSASQLQTVIEGYHPGDKVSVTWIDSFGQTQTGTATLTTGPAA